MVYKIVTKVIINRIKPILPILISNTQEIFVQIKITDNIVIMQEVLHPIERKQGSKGLMAIKIDFKKAYDPLRWLFIRDTLLQNEPPPLACQCHYGVCHNALFRFFRMGNKPRASHQEGGYAKDDYNTPYF